MDISLEYYRTFYEIVRCGSFSKAAAKLFVSQSNVSQALSKLEDALGLTLIERTTKRMKLTDAGELLYADVALVMENIESAEQKVKRLVRMEEGSIKIGVSDTICRYILMPFLSDFKKRYPAIHFTLSNRPSAVSVGALTGGELDLAVVNLLPNMYETHTHITPLKSFKEVFIVKTDSGLSDATPIQEWLEQPFVSLEQGATTRDFVSSAFEHLGYAFDPVIELSSLDLIFDFVVHGFGVGVVPNYALPHHSDVRAVDIPIDMPTRQLGVVVSSKMPQNVATKQFIKELCGYFSRQQ